MTLDILLFLSVLINIVFIFYCRWLIKMYRGLTEDVTSIQEMIQEYLNHLNSIYELEMFYGDQTLSLLLEHGKELIKNLEGIDLLEPEEEDDEYSKEA